jgi:hypothetical protein
MFLPMKFNYQTAFKPRTNSEQSWLHDQLRVGELSSQQLTSTGLISG